MILRRAICENIQYYTSKQLFRYDDCISLYDVLRQKKTRKLAAQAADYEFLFNDEARQLCEAKAELEKVKFELQKAIDNFTQEKQKNQSLKDSLGETAQLRQSLATLQQMQVSLPPCRPCPRQLKKPSGSFCWFTRTKSTSLNAAGIP